MPLVFGRNVIGQTNNLATIHLCCLTLDLIWDTVRIAIECKFESHKRCPLCDIPMFRVFSYLCWECVIIQMSGLMDLPAELLCTIIYKLPLTDRARLETVCKQLYYLSTTGATEISLRLASKEEPTGLARWLSNLRKRGNSSLRSLCLTSSTAGLTAKGISIAWDGIWSRKRSCLLLWRWCVNIVLDCSLIPAWCHAWSVITPHLLSSRLQRPRNKSMYLSGGFMLHTETHYTRLIA